MDIDNGDSQVSTLRLVQAVLEDQTAGVSQTQFRFEPAQVPDPGLAPVFFRKADWIDKLVIQIDELIT